MLIFVDTLALSGDICKFVRVFEIKFFLFEAPVNVLDAQTTVFSLLESHRIGVLKLSFGSNPSCNFLIPPIMLRLFASPPALDIFILLIGNFVLVIKHFKIKFQLLLSKQVVNLCDWIAVKTIVFLKLHLMPIDLFVALVVQGAYTFFLLLLVRKRDVYSLTPRNFHF